MGTSPARKDVVSVLRSGLEELFVEKILDRSTASVELKSPNWQLDEFVARPGAQTSFGELDMDSSQRNRLLSLVAGTYRKDRMVWDSLPR